MAVCDLCGKTPPDDPDTVPLTWMTSIENGDTKLFCDTCAREHLRSIEAKLDSAWW